MRRVALGFVALAGCFTGQSAQGLPCTADEYCAGLRCIDGFCGGGPDSLESSTGALPSTSDTSATMPSTAMTIDTTMDTTMSATDPTMSMDSSSETTAGPATCEDLGCWADCLAIAPAGPFVSDGQPVDLEVSEMNGDLPLDLFTVNSLGDGMGSLELRNGIAGGSFAGSAPTHRVLADAPTGTAVGDLDDVPHADAVVTYFGSNQASVFLWNLDNYSAVGGEPMAVGTGPRAPVVLDIDGEPPLDVAFATGSGIEAFMGITPASVVHHVFVNSYFIDDMIGVRFEGSDALLVTHLSFGEVTLYRLPPETSATEELRFVPMVQPAHVGVGDFDGDADDDDVVIATETGDLWLAPSFLDDWEEDTARMIGTFDGTPNGFAVGQIDGVCGVDVAVIVHSGVPDADDDVIVYRNDGERLADPVALEQYGSYSVKIVDLDADGVGEIVIGGGAGDVRIARYER